MMHLGIVVPHTHLGGERHIRNSVLNLKLINQPLTSWPVQLVARIRLGNCGTVSPSKGHVRKF
jgi:hypothetical protein